MAPPRFPARPQALAWVLVDKKRPGIVLEVNAGQVTVLVGTGTERPHVPRVVVEPTSVAGKALRLSKPTYFYASGLRVVLSEHVEAQALCSLGLFLEFKELVGQ